MPLPLKRKSKAAAGPAVPAWHPNFRDYQTLPDVKVVRTAFFANGLAMLVTVVLALYLGMQEWQLRGLNTQIAEFQRQIDRTKAPSSRAVALYRRFQAEEARPEQAGDFVNSRPHVSRILLHLAQTLPEHVAVDSFDFGGKGLTLRFSVSGEPEAAAGYATAYLDQLRADKELAEFDRTKFVFSNQARNQGTGGLAAEFFLQFAPPLQRK